MRKGRSHEGLLRSRSAIDVSTGYGAEAFIKSGTLAEPWAHTCFVSTIEACLNHAQFRYPFPSHYSVDYGESAGLPDFMLQLQNAGVLQADDGVVAEDVVLSEDELRLYFSIFQLWILNRPEQVKQWLKFHFQRDVRRRYKTQMPQGISSEIEEYYGQQEMQFKRLGGQLKTQPRRVLYGFEVVCRGRKYAILLGDRSNYYAHPIRDCLLVQAETRRDSINQVFSWGRYLAWALRDGRVRREPQEVIALVSRLKSTIGKLHATPHELSVLPQSDQLAKLHEVAAEAGLPASVRPDVHQQIAQFFQFVHLGVALVHAPAIHLSLALGDFVATRVRNVPGWIPRSFPFTRGIVEYPDPIGD